MSSQYVHVLYPRSLPIVVGEHDRTHPPTTPSFVLCHGVNHLLVLLEGASVPVSPPTLPPPIRPSNHNPRLLPRRILISRDSMPICVTSWNNVVCNSNHICNAHAIDK